MLLPKLHQMLSLAAIVAASPTPQDTSNPLVTLDYGTFQGAVSTKYNLTYFRKIPFGASTAGHNRFRAPQPPAPITNGTYDSNQAFDMCPQRTVNGSEDCLYLGVYSRPWTKAQSLRPVLLTFYGGGFIRGSASFDMPPSGFPVLNVSTQNDYVVVYSNYRTNVFGFLPGKKIAQHPDVDLNPGLLDQQAALKWIQKNIHHFGGDNHNVTIWGQSAGGGSVIAQTIATGNRGKNLFQKAMVSSPFWPKIHRYDSPWAESLYQQTLLDIGCANTTTTADDEIRCLKTANLQTLRETALKLSSSQQYTTATFTWGPVLDTTFLTQPLSALLRHPNPLNAKFTQASYNLHEGENFIPPGFQNATSSTSSTADGFNSSTASFDAWLRGYLPDFSPRDRQAVKALYPAAGRTEVFAWNTTYLRAGFIYRDLVLACPAYWIAKKAQRGALLQYTISPAKHASDVQYWNTLTPIQTTDPLTYTAYAGAMASFIQTADPNAHKVTNATVPAVPFITSGLEFQITPEGLKTGRIPLLEQRCAFWERLGGKVPM
ncbi:hypothetical protein IAQ61_009720 [Plenodomus lingam]|uniref:Carboxylic ester hydrolase n=1 Tax=Leptosphaeria maculans (strain JN3 / isolate v23.1.3 / race Av1-4-5-6-7-8) TaxID=985895 RepID=E4ZUU8_LEPMJ|nr:similar to carboxylesterase [Plenodomus lingam JN3]KAH9863442.1 hypothetical protein IAQ61_009720 [Plenodomus lingam]CBX95177.1 similar to carboxylesterase [Plenodomus lingam JN3]